MSTSAEHSGTDACGSAEVCVRNRQSTADLRFAKCSCLPLFCLLSEIMCSFVMVISAPQTRFRLTSTAAEHAERSTQPAQRSRQTRAARCLPSSQVSQNKIGLQGRISNARDHSDQRDSYSCIAIQRCSECVSSTVRFQLLGEHTRSGTAVCCSLRCWMPYVPCHRPDIRAATLENKTI